MLELVKRQGYVYLPCPPLSLLLVKVIGRDLCILSIFTTQFAPRPAGFQCPFASRVQSFCDAPDPFCCNGDDQAVHEGYAAEYGSQALAFILNQLSAFGA